MGMVRVQAANKKHALCPLKYLKEVQQGTGINTWTGVTKTETRQVCKAYSILQPKMSTNKHCHTYQEGQPCLNKWPGFRSDRSTEESGQGNPIVKGTIL